MTGLHIWHKLASYTQALLRARARWERDKGLVPVVRACVEAPRRRKQLQKRTSLVTTEVTYFMLTYSVVTATGAQNNKLSLQRHSPVPMLSFDTEEEELNIATRADTMMTARSPPSSCSITNGRVCSSHIQ